MLHHKHAVEERKPAVGRVAYVTRQEVTLADDAIVRAVRSVLTKHSLYFQSIELQIIDLAC